MTDEMVAAMPSIDARAARGLHQQIQSGLSGAAEAALKLEATHGWVHLGDYPTFRSYLTGAFSEASRSFLSRVTLAADQRKLLAAVANGDTAPAIAALPESALRTLRKAGPAEAQVEALTAAGEIADRAEAKTVTAAHIAQAVEERRSAATAPSVALDLAGAAAPARLADIFETGRTLQKLANEVAGIGRQVQEIGKDSGGRYLKCGEIKTVVSRLRRCLLDNGPFCLCAVCAGEGCGDCVKLGWLTREQAKATKDET